MLSRPSCKENIKRFVVFYAGAEDRLRAIFSSLPTFCRGYIFTADHVLSRRFLLQTAFAVDRDAFAVEVYGNGAVVGYAAVDNALGDVVFEFLLDNSSQGTRAVLYIVALFDDVVHSGVGNLKRDVAFFKRFFEFSDENAGDLLDFVRSERMEEANDVYSVEEFGLEVAF